MKKKVFASALLAGTMILSSVPCSAASAADRMANSTAVMETIQSMDLDFEMGTNITIDSGEEGTMEIPISYLGTMTLFQEPLKAKMEISADMGMLGSMNMLMYMELLDGSLASYVNVTTPDALEGSWIKQTVPMGDPKELQASMTEQIGVDPNSLVEYTDLGPDTLNDMETTKIQGVITGETFAKIFEAAKVNEQMAAMGVPFDFSALFGSLGDLNMNIWLDENDRTVRYEMDMTDFANNLAGQILPLVNAAAAAQATAAATEGETPEIPEINITFSDLVILMNMGNFDAAEAFEIPLEAAAAQDINELASAAAQQLEEGLVEPETTE